MFKLPYILLVITKNMLDEECFSQAFREILPLITIITSRATLSIL